MLPELGHFALIIALCVAAIQGVLPMLGAVRGIPAWTSLARPAAWMQFLFLGTAFALLAQAFIANDFSVAYVAGNSNSNLPLVYRISAVWGGHEGSLLLWALMLAGWSAAVALFSRSLPALMVARVLSILGLVSMGFLSFILVTSNPFARLALPPVDGRDLNPLLQDPGLVLHPPALYMGYVGFSVAFAFAMAALIEGRLDAAWARWSRPWTLMAWVFLTLGIALGSWWAYYELGWGGWWFWDPVENASLLPWLAGTALLHSLAVAEKRGVFKSWTILLAVLAFSLSLLGTFLVRSGVLTSVHAFASDPGRGVFILILLATVVGTSLLLYARHAPRIAGSGRFQPFSRETFLLANNVLLVVAVGTILLGTLYPLILDALGLGKISVGPPYFNTVFVPVITPLILLLGVGALVRWKSDSPRRVARSLALAAPASIALGVALPWLAHGRVTPGAAFGATLAFWVALSALIDLRHRLDSGPGMLSKLYGDLRRGALSGYGMSLAHIGVAVSIAGITLSAFHSEERDLRMAPGDIVTVGDYQFEFHGVVNTKGPNYGAQAGRVSISKDGHDVATVVSEKRSYGDGQMPMTEAGIEAGLFRDLYVALGSPLDDGAWALRIHYKPFVRWIWLGALLMALGGLLAALDRRYRLASRAAPRTGT